MRLGCPRLSRGGCGVREPRQPCGLSPAEAVNPGLAEGRGGGGRGAGEMGLPDHGGGPGEGGSRRWLGRPPPPPAGALPRPPWPAERQEAATLPPQPKARQHMGRGWQVPTSRL